MHLKRESNRFNCANFYTIANSRSNQHTSFDVYPVAYIYEYKSSPTIGLISLWGF